MKNERYSTDSPVIQDDGIVYLLINEAMPGLVKIGKTTREDPSPRMNELYSTGVPVPFECTLAIRVKDPSKVEEELHKAFESNRINPKREFFHIDPEQPAAVLRLLINMGAEDVTPKVNEENNNIPENERNASERLLSRRPNLNFNEMGISVGSVLTSVSGDETVIVVADRRVEFEGEEMSLTQATKKVRNISYNVNPSRHWTHEGRSLHYFYNQTYPLHNQ